MQHGPVSADDEAEECARLRGRRRDSGFVLYRGPFCDRMVEIQNME